MNELRNRLREQKGSMLWLLLSSVFAGAAVIGQAYFLVAAVDGVFLQGETFAEVLPLLGGLLLMLAARVFFQYTSGRTGVRMAARAKRGLRRSLLERFTSQPVQASMRGQSGQKVSVMMDAVDEVDSYFSEYLPQLVKTSFLPLVVLIVVFTQHVNSGLIMLITAPFLPIFMIIIGMQTQKKSEEQLEKLGAFSGTFLDTLQGLVTLKLFGRARQQKEKIESSSLGFRDATMEILKVAFTQSFMLEVVTMLSIGIIALELAIQLIIYESISFFTAFLVLVLVPEFYTSLKELGSAFHNGRSSMGAAKKVEEELQEPEEGINWGDQSLTSAPPEIRMKDASYSYGEDRFQLGPLTMEIPPYSQAAIVGHSGSGKSTLLHLLAGLVEAGRGEMLVNGSPRQTYKEVGWFAQLSYISQHPYIFSGTIAENIAIGKSSAVSREEITRAAEKAGLDSMIRELSHGYDTPVGEAGRGLSGGEQQRLALARAFLKQPSVVLFDEPTTGLDLGTERMLQESIRELGKTATIITVAHRLHTIRGADQIFLLSDGKLQASGTHEELLESTADYRAMVGTQKGGDVS
ncbi:thiol reductant ABC exporter subunit CydD [Lentibacillus sediminis]|uniref:thiol reductant ABC exporter subunit CydD n=1 Tax=Lentibacillus sediminis TaxID=1940529 RepID=UPI000C1C4F3D|nr:thiol reductant ABC exporter subunit CydD [Lentibacillus sediminis]